jgi:hypothetical protein
MNVDMRDAGKPVMNNKQTNMGTQSRVILNGGIPRSLHKARHDFHRSDFSRFTYIIARTCFFYLPRA